MIVAADLTKPIEELEFSSGRKVPIRGISGIAYELRKALHERFAEFNAGTAEFTEDDLETVYRYGAALLPDATADEVRSLSADAVMLVGEIACGHLEKVLAFAEERQSGNAKGAAAKGSPSAPATGSRTPRSKSGKRSARGRARS